MNTNKTNDNQMLDKALEDLKQEQGALSSKALDAKTVDDAAVVKSSAKARKASKTALDARAEAEKIAESEKAKAQAEVEKAKAKAKAKEKAQKEREKVRAKEKALKDREKAKAREKAQKEREKARAKAKALKERERAKAKEKAQKEREKLRAKEKALKEREKAKAKEKALKDREKAKEKSATSTEVKPLEENRPIEKVTLDFAKAHKVDIVDKTPRDARQIVEDKLAARRALEASAPKEVASETLFGKPVREPLEQSKALTSLKKENETLKSENEELKATLSTNAKRLQDALERQSATQMNEEALKARLDNERARAQKSAGQAKEVRESLALLKKDHAALVTKATHLEAIANGYDAAIAASDAEKKALAEHVQTLDEQLKLERAANSGNREQFQKAMDEINNRIDQKLSEVENAKQGIGSEISRLETENEELKKKIKELESTIPEVDEQKVSALTEANEQLTLDNQRYTELMARAQADATHAQDQLAMEKEENDRLKKSLAESDDSAASLQQTLSDTVEKYDAERKAKEIIEAEASSLKEEIQKANEALIEKDKQIQALSKENAELTQNLSTRDSDYEATKKENEALARDKDHALIDLLSAQVALKSAKEQVEAIDEMKASYEATIAEKDDEIIKARNEIAQLERKTNDLLATVDDQLNQLATATQNAKENAEEIASLKTDIASQGKAYQSWKEAFDASVKESAATSESDNRAADERITALMNENTSLKEELAKASAERPIYEAGRSYLVADEAIPLEIRQGYGAYASDYVDKKRYLAIIAELQAENDALKTAPHNDELERQVRELKKEVAILKASATDDALVQKLEAENKLLRNTIAASLSKEEARLNEPMKEEGLAEDIASCQKEIASKDEEITSLAQKISDETRKAQNADPTYLKRIAHLSSKENVTKKRIAAQETLASSLLDAATTRKNTYETSYKELLDKISALKKSYQDKKDNSSEAKAAYEKEHLALSYQRDDIKQRLDLASEDLERATVRFKAFQDAKEADIKALQLSRKEIVDSAMDAAEKSDSVATLKAQYQVLLKEKLNLQEKLNGFLALKKAADSHTALKQAEEAIDLEAYRSASGTDAKIRELTRQYIKLADQEKSVVTELKKRSDFIKELRERSPQVRDYIVLMDQAKRADRTKDDARQTLINTKIASLKTTREVQVYEKIVEHITRLSKADQEQIRRLGVLRSAIDALRAEQVAKA